MTFPPIRRSRLLSALVVATTASSLLAAGIGPADAKPKRQKARADLVVAAATVDRASVARGATVVVAHTVRNKGAKRAAATTTRLYLATGAGRSPIGQAAVKALGPGRKGRVPAVSVIVPADTAPGTYTLLLCADGLGKVREARERNNCRTAAPALQVTAPDAPPTPTPPGPNPPNPSDLPAYDVSGTLLQSFSETQAWPEDEDGLPVVKAFCASTHPAQPHTLASALASARARLEALAPGGVAQVAGSPLAATPVQAQALAAGGLAQGSPGLALAALLRAHDLEPNRAAHLVNAAALSSSLGLPNEAIAFLDAAASREFRLPAFGLSQQATMSVIRGNALIMLGDYAAAQPLFEQAKQLAPVLVEADTGLATVAACKGQDVLAARYLRRSRTRTDEPVPATPPTEDPARPEPELDRGQGRVTPLRELPVAETPAQGVAMDEVYQGIQQGFGAEGHAYATEVTQLQDHLSQTDELRSRAEIVRRGDLLTMAYEVSSHPEAIGIRAEYDEIVDDLTEVREEFFGGGTGEEESTYDELTDDAWDACVGSDDAYCWIKEMSRTCRPELNRAHIRYRTKLLALQDVGNRLQAYQSKAMSGLAANLVDDEAHRLVLLEIEQAESSTYAGIVQQARAWTHLGSLYRTECVDPLPAEVLDPPTDPDAESGAKCDGALKAMNFRAALGPTSLKVSCERIEQSFSLEIIPLLSVFADVKFDFRTGNVSVWVGSKGGGSIGGIDAGFKSGIYVKVDQQGDLVDVGWRVGPSVTAGAGPAEFEAYNTEFDMSFTESKTPGY